MLEGAAKSVTVKIHRIWSAPAERSDDGAMDLASAEMANDPKRCRRSALPPHSKSDQPIAQRFRHSFGLRMDLKFLIDVLEMKIDCSRGHA